MKLYLVGCLLLFTACSQQKTEVFPLDIRDSTVVTEPIPSTRVTKSYVVAHPPPLDSMAKLALRLAQEQNPAYPTQDIWVVHSFYRETRYTPRTFRESSERNGKLDAHGEDLLLDILHARSATMDCWFVNLPRQSAPSQSFCVPLDSASTLPPAEPIPEAP